RARNAREKNDIIFARMSLSTSSTSSLRFAAAAFTIWRCASTRLNCSNRFGEALRRFSIACLSTSRMRSRVSAVTVAVRGAPVISDISPTTSPAALTATSRAPAGAREVAVSAAGDVVGEMSLMTGAPRTATVTALTRLRILEVDKQAIENLLKASPNLFEQFSRVLAQRQMVNAAAANRKEDVEEVESDILAKMMSFFSRAFRARQPEGQASR